LAGLGWTALAAGDFIDVAYRSLAAHIVLDTASSCVAIVVAYLVYGRLLRDHRLQDLLLLQGLALLGCADLGAVFLDPLTGSTPPGSLDTWFPLATRVIALGFVAASSLAPRDIVVARSWDRWSLAGAASVLVALLVVIGGFAGRLPVAVDPDIAPADGGTVFEVGHPLLAAGLTVSIILLGIATAAFTNDARRDGDETLRWFAAACALGVFARVNYVLYPSLYSHWLYSGDVLRAGFYLLLLIGAAREVRRHWQAEVDTAVAHDRRRLARELHDGVLQELVYIRAESRRLNADDVAAVDRIRVSCDRAIDEARQAVEVLGADDDEPLGYAVRRVVNQVAERHGLHVGIEVDEAVRATPEQRHAVVRITREAVSNAARHGHATGVTVRLERRGAARTLMIADDGAGFDPSDASVTAGGFGLTAMRERAGELPGRLEITSSPESGTTVEVRW
jgi:signal transduction histidine kinase